MLDMREPTGTLLAGRLVMGTASRLTIIKYIQKRRYHNSRTPPLNPGTLNPPHIKLSELKCLSDSSQGTLSRRSCYRDKFIMR